MCVGYVWLCVRVVCVHVCVSIQPAQAPRSYDPPPPHPPSSDPQVVIATRRDGSWQAVDVNVLQREVFADLNQEQVCYGGVCVCDGRLSPIVCPWVGEVIRCVRVLLSPSPPPPHFHSPYRGSWCVPPVGVVGGSGTPE